ncbi:MAG: hypothetical protein C4346_18455 [Chloroflexota bacterium]
MNVRLRKLATTAGPVLFTSAWLYLGSVKSEYSPIREPISRLAAKKAETRVPMSLGLASLACSFHLFASGPASRDVWSARLAHLVAWSTLGIALTPLDSQLGGVPHAVAAGVSYASLAALPARQAWLHNHEGNRRACSVSLAVALGTAVPLVLSVRDTARTGLWQRLGLIVGHSWMFVTAFRSTASL